MGPVMALAAPPGATAMLDTRQRHRAIEFAGYYAPIWMADIDALEGFEVEVAAINEWRHAEPNLFAGPPARLVSAPGSEIAVLAHGTAQAPGLVVAVNPDPEQEAALPASSVLPEIGTSGALVGAEERIEAGEMIRLMPGEVRVFRFAATPPIRHVLRKTAPPKRARALGGRIVIEGINPSVDDGFPVKRIAGETVQVETKLVTDGHGRVDADLLWRPADSNAWRRVEMKPLGNDRYVASFPVARVGRYLFSVEAWLNPFSTLMDEIEKKRNAGAGIVLETEEVIALVRGVAGTLDSIVSGDQLEHLAKPEIAAVMRHARQEHLTRLEPERIVDAERPIAGFASWYELFPRSQSPDPGRHGTFLDVIERLPAIRAMGFDVLYFPPIHPIGRIHRKGRNNALTCEPTDPGSPYAIGAEEGGHDAIHPDLGTLDDFNRLREEAAKHGIELAIDLAIQCAPDHPWVKSHPEWFEWRSDGSIRCAENPPKRYEDIVNVAFYAPKATPSLWTALRDVVWFWVEKGIRIFRVDNPHTKPLPFWQWMIDDVRGRAPDVMFLAEAFTRPAMMYQLAKIGFSQSYTYFTWRNMKRELIEYFDEIAQPPVADFFRPHLFVNTPDINPFFLQQGGRPAFLIRAVLAATLSGLWGMYNGFELCEARALPGREEYLDSEKYQIRSWDWDRPGNIIAEISRLNEIRRGNPALHSHRGLAFLNASDDAMLYYAKASADGRNTLLIAVNLDPRRVVEADIEIPLWRFGLPDDAMMEADDLIRMQPVTWHGKRQHVRLDPAEMPFAIWRLKPRIEGAA